MVTLGGGLSRSTSITVPRFDLHDVADEVQDGIGEVSQRLELMISGYSVEKWQSRMIIGRKLVAIPQEAFVHSQKEGAMNSAKNHESFNRPIQLVLPPGRLWLAPLVGQSYLHVNRSEHWRNNARPDASYFWGSIWGLLILYAYSLSGIQNILALLW